MSSAHCPIYYPMPISTAWSVYSFIAEFAMGQRGQKFHNMFLPLWGFENPTCMQTTRLTHPTYQQYLRIPACMYVRMYVSEYLMAQAGKSWVSLIICLA